ncbi:MAG TPA: bifunctional rhamnulose-1-phosphate aldolase/short-chain dehydrogenase [Chloroflexota bacterium]|nr:bifunctional rhamnulose-1-phosphate aldolase/short-chain dehydrogenase [Chloroflexota bacterium]
MPADRWSEPQAAGRDDLDLLVYRSNLLGSDRDIVNFGGGNTSSKTDGADHTGRPCRVLWVKGSGSDLASATRRSFSPLRLDEITPLSRRDAMTDDQMVDYLSRCLLDPQAARPSIETMLHAFLPFPHVDHTHPTAAIALCCMSSGEELVRELFGDDAVWVPYVRPGFALAKLAEEALKERPGAGRMFLAKHGLVTWGETTGESYERTIETLNRVESRLEPAVDPSTLFGGQAVSPSREEVRRSIMVDVLPAVRGQLAKTGGPERRWILHWDSSPQVMDFVNSKRCRELAETGAACPDHVMYTKFKPMVLDLAACLGALTTGKSETLVAALDEAIHDYVEQYQRWFEENADPGVEMLDPGPRILLIPGFGLIAVGRDAWSAANAASLYRTAIGVMRYASSAGTYASLTPKEAWDIEYWPLELYKLTLRPAPGILDGQVAVITGGAGAIGRATAARMLKEDAHVVLGDIDGEAAVSTAEALGGSKQGRVIAVESDATDEVANQRLMEQAVLSFGGCDIVVPNAGVASAAPIEDTSLEEWLRVQELLSTGYFLACREAFRLFKRQGLGGVIVINSSKNGLAPGKNAVAYATAKAADLHMCRCLAEEGGPEGIRVNAVAPDAVIQGSGLWNDSWRQERARTYAFDVDRIEDFYRDRNALKVNVAAEDVAEAIVWLASCRSAKTTGCVITVDGGLAAAYPR